jgi:KipI family sensor histidine kinase inhibitor
MPVIPRFLPAGDSVLVAEYGDRIDETINAHIHLVSQALDRRRPAGVVEVVPTYRSIAIHLDPLRTDRAALQALVRHIDADVAAYPPPIPRTVEIPVVYGGEYGPDLADVATHAGLSAADVVAIHAAGTYRVYMMGFTPGFPYLGGLSPRIATPRLPSPRTHVPAGSVGIAGPQTGIYPTASPGGWRLIGRTPLPLFDQTQDPPTLVDAGDTVRFVPVLAEGIVWSQGATAVEHEADEVSEPGIDVLDGGMLTTVQDLGRLGYQRCGVPVAGAMDPIALRAANRLVGNDDGEAGLEMTIVGPTLRAARDVVIAITGADLQPQLNGRPGAMWRAARLRAGDEVVFAGVRHGQRAYLAVRGGIAVPLVLRSRSTYLASRLGGVNGRALRAGDRLPIGTTGRRPIVVRQTLVPPWLSPGGTRRIRVVLGPQADAFTDAGLSTFLSAPFVLSVKSDRVGCRLEGPAIEHRRGADIVSDGTAFGSIQVTGDGMPIILMADRGTTGGYTKIATVASADLHLVSQAAPGDVLRFEAVSVDEATAALCLQDQWFGTIEKDADGTADEIFDEDSGAPWAVEGIGEFADALQGRGRQDGPFASGVCAGMSGLVVAVLVAPGQTVAARETLLVLEAMKMQNPIRAPKPGTIREVRVSPGDHVDANAVLIEYED